MALAGWSIYTAPMEDIDAAMLRTFLDEQREIDLVAESMTLELKERQRGDNVVKAVAGLANHDGGIVLVGIPDEDPTFDTAPGVDLRALVSISEQLRSSLDPLPDFEVAPVALPGGDKVVLVIRVDAVVSGGPVVKNGAVLVRAPGQTIGATRDQIVALVGRSVRGATAGLPSLDVANLFGTRALDAEAAGGAPDFRVRVGGAIVLRASAADGAMLGSAHRESLTKTFAESAFARAPLSVNGRYRSADQRPRPVFDERTSRAFEVSWTAVDRHTEGQYVVSMRVVRQGAEVAYAVTLEARVLAERGNRTPRVSRGEFATALVEGVEAVALVLPQAIQSVLGVALRQQSPTRVWVDSLGPLSATLDTTRMYVDEAQHVGDRWGFEVAASPDLDAIALQVGTELRRLYLDLGVDDEATAAEQDIRDALAQRQRDLAM